MGLKDYASQTEFGRVGYVVLHRWNDEIELETGERARDQDFYDLVRDCPLCGKESRVKVPAQGLWNWEHGSFVQQAFPDLSAGEREQVMTGMHDNCFDDAVPESDEFNPKEDV